MHNELALGSTLVVDHMIDACNKHLNPLPICYFGILTFSIFIIALSYFLYNQISKK